MRNPTTVRTIAWLMLFYALASTGVVAQHKHPNNQRPDAGPRRQSSANGKPGVIEVGPARLAIPDVEVLDQNGRQVRLYSDLIKGKVVVVSFFFTSCTLVCPIQGRALVKVQTQLGPRLGKEIFFVSISRDPLVDTPERLRRWAANYGVGPGWTLVTGEQDVMTKLLRDFTGESPGDQMHSPVVLIGNDRTGVWTEVGGLRPPEEFVEVIDKIGAWAGTAQR